VQNTASRAQYADTHRLGSNVIDELVGQLGVKCHHHVTYTFRHAAEHWVYRVDMGGIVDDKGRVALPGLSMR